MSATTLDILTMALKTLGVVGVGETPLAEDTADAFTRLNWMIGQWRRKRWLMYRLEDKSFVANGNESFSIGPGGDVNVAYRPDRVEAAYVRQLQNNNPSGSVDYPLDLIQSREQYSRIVMKELQSFPTWLFYDPDFPLGQVYPWPVPQASLYETHILIKSDLPYSTDYSSTLIMPDEYIEALHLNLACRLAPMYTVPLDPQLLLQAKDARDVLRKASFAVGNLKLPVSLTRSGIYNPYSDQIR